MRARLSALSRGRWLARLALALALLSGAPTAIALALGLGADACECECPGSGGSKQCPPFCSHGACAKVLAVVPVEPRAITAPILALEAPIPALEATVPVALLFALHSLWQPGRAERPPRS